MSVLVEAAWHHAQSHASAWLWVASVAVAAASGWAQVRSARARRTAVVVHNAACEPSATFVAYTESGWLSGPVLHLVCLDCGLRWTASVPLFARRDPDRGVAAGEADSDGAA